MAMPRCIVTARFFGLAFIAIDVAEELEREAFFARDLEFAGHGVGLHEVLAGAVKVASEAVDVA